MRDSVLALAAEAEAESGIAVEVVLVRGKRTSAVELHAVDGGAVNAALGVESVVA